MSFVLLVVEFPKIDNYYYFMNLEIKWGEIGGCTRKYPVASCLKLSYQILNHIAIK